MEVRLPEQISQLPNIEAATEEVNTTDEKTMSLFQFIKSYFVTSHEPKPLEEGQVKKEDLESKPEVQTLCGIVGKGEMFRKVRVTWINGIDHTHEDARNVAIRISKAFGDVNVHYVYNETAGFWNDLTRAGWQKIAGKATPEVMALAAHFKRLIAEMGGVDSGGRIVHLAHSQGAIITYLAKAYLTEAERNMIDVITFGPAQVITSEDYHSAINYISEKDPLLFVNRAALAVWRSGKPTNEIICLTPIASHGYIDHSMDGPTYRAVLNVVAKSFRDEYETYASRFIRWVNEKWQSFKGNDPEIIL